MIGCAISPVFVCLFDQFVCVVACLFDLCGPREEASAQRPAQARGTPQRPDPRPVPLQVAPGGRLLPGDGWISNGSDHWMTGAHCVCYHFM